MLDTSPARQADLQQAEADFQAVPFGSAASGALGCVAASLRIAGREPRPRAYDALVAATAIAQGLPLYTGNPDDFLGIDGLELRPVPHPDHTR